MENKDLLIQQWLEEEKEAHIHGWDFSHIHNRYEEEKDLPWDYEKIVRKYLSPEKKVLDIDTGGGEFLLSLGHPNENLAATEAYPPNVQLCRETLLPLGIDFKEALAEKHLPFKTNSFDLVLNRHGDYNVSEIYRVLKPGGVFLTEQVGAENDRDLVELLYEQAPPLPYPEQYLSITENKFRETGFTLLGGEEAWRPIKFYDTGALVWFARIIEWEFPRFSVENNLKGLFRAQKLLQEKGVIQGRIHRYLLSAAKYPEKKNG